MVMFLICCYTQTQRPSIPTFEPCVSYFKMSFVMIIIIVKTKLLCHPHSFKWVLSTELVFSKTRPTGMYCLFLLLSRGLFFSKPVIIQSFMYSHDK